MQCVYACGFHQFGDGVARMMVDVYIPFHGRAGGKKGCERLDRSQRLNGVGCGAVYLGDGAEFGFGVAIAWGLATPWTSVDVRLVVYDPDNGGVVVHQVASGQVS